MYASKVTKLIAGIAAMFLHIVAMPATIPLNAQKQIPVLKRTLNTHWDNTSMPSLFAGQIEQESCISLTHPRCWNPNVELKTAREYGFGLGQLTIAYDKRGNVRFDNFTISKKQFPQLNAWKWENRFDPFYQMTTMVLMDKNFYNKVNSLTSNEQSHLAFMLSAYNGGLGGVIQDRKLCEGIAGCDPTKWTNNVAKYSFKSKVKVHGYGEAAFDINRGYVDNILNQRRQKYIPYLEPLNSTNQKALSN